MLTTDDRLDITDTIALHAHLFDGNHLDRLDELFTTDAVYDMSRLGLPALQGIEAIRAAAVQMTASGHAPTAHYVTNIVITTDDDAATAASKGLVIMADGAIESVTHEDTLRRQNGSWRISSRVITPVRPTSR